MPTISEARRIYTADEWRGMTAVIALTSPDVWDQIRDGVIGEMTAELKPMSEFYERIHGYHDQVKRDASLVPEWAMAWMREVKDAMNLPKPGGMLADTWVDKLQACGGDPDAVVQSMREIAAASGIAHTPEQIEELAEGLLTVFRDGYAYYLEDLFDLVCAATEHQLDAMRDDYEAAARAFPTQRI